MKIKTILKIFKLNFRLMQVHSWTMHTLREKIKLFFYHYYNFMHLFIKKYFPALIKKIKKKNFPTYIFIETISSCNSRCIICPAFEISKELPQGKMSWFLYKKIIDECCKYKVSTIYLYLTNEPLLDEDIVERIKYAKVKMPSIKIFLSTNASLLTPEKTSKLIKYVDLFIFSVFGITKQDYEKMMPGLNYENTMENINYFIRFRRENGLKSRAIIRHIVTNSYLLKKDSIKQLRKIYNFWRERGINWLCNLFLSRAGNVVNFQYSTKKNKCLRGCWCRDTPLTYMHIIFNGDVILCCMDCRREVILGNVNEKSIYEIWNGKLYNDIRDRIYLNKNNKNDDNFLCNRCINPILTF